MEDKKKSKNPSYGLHYNSKGVLVANKKRGGPPKWVIEKMAQAKLKKVMIKKARGIIFLELQKYKTAGGKIDFSGYDQDDILQHLIMIVAQRCGIEDEEQIETLYLNVLDSLLLGGNLALIEAEKADAFNKHKEIREQAIEDGKLNVARDANKDILEYFGITKQEKDDPISSYARYSDENKEIEMFRGSPAELISAVQRKRRKDEAVVTKVLKDSRKKPIEMEDEDG